MKPFRSARFVRIGEWQGQPVAEVEAYEEGESDPLAVTLAWDGMKYQPMRVLRNRADHELDWYDNDLHQAFEQEPAWMSGQEWVQTLLATDGLQVKLEQEMDLNSQTATDIRG